MAEAIVRRWIVDILQQRLDLVGVAVRQRAKFEGWLKFELAAHAQQQGATDVQVEMPLSTAISNLTRSDMTFILDGTHYDVELKTFNTSWLALGVQSVTRPTTGNIASIVDDGEKLRGCKGRGIIAFVLFPVPLGDNRWKAYLKRIASGLNLPLSVQEHTSRLSVPVYNGHRVDVIVCCFDIPKTAPSFYKAIDSEAIDLEAINLEAQEQLTLCLQ